MVSTCSESMCLKKHILETRVASEGACTARGDWRIAVEPQVVNGVASTPPGGISRDPQKRRRETLGGRLIVLLTPGSCRLDRKEMRLYFGLLRQTSGFQWEDSAPGVRDEASAGDDGEEVPCYV